MGVELHPAISKAAKDAAMSLFMFSPSSFFCRMGRDLMHQFLGMGPQAGSRTSAA
jgi:hypothetical protein